MDKPQISIVVIGKNEISHIHECLQAVSDAVDESEYALIDEAGYAEDIY